MAHRDMPRPSLPTYLPKPSPNLRHTSRATPLYHVDSWTLSGSSRQPGVGRRMAFTPGKTVVKCPCIHGHMGYLATSRSRMRWQPQQLQRRAGAITEARTRSGYVSKPSVSLSSRRAARARLSFSAALRLMLTRRLLLSPLSVQASRASMTSAWRSPRG